MVLTCTVPGTSYLPPAQSDTQSLVGHVAGCHWTAAMTWQSTWQVNGRSAPVNDGQRRSTAAVDDGQRRWTTVDHRRTTGQRWLTASQPVGLGRVNVWAGPGRIGNGLAGPDDSSGAVRRLPEP
ncbi:hypothetical protein Tco_0797217 [Tanacetum coccineum]